MLASATDHVEAIKELLRMGHDKAGQSPKRVCRVCFGGADPSMSCGLPVQPGCRRPPRLWMRLLRQFVSPSTSHLLPGRRALMLAAAHGRRECLQELLACGATKAGMVQAMRQLPWVFTRAGPGIQGQRWPVPQVGNRVGGIVNSSLGFDHAACLGSWSNILVVLLG